jgi:hypothetical protein
MQTRELQTMQGCAYARARLPRVLQKNERFTSYYTCLYYTFTFISAFNLTLINFVSTI